ncbi:MAG: DUF4783 domain-containing protein [Bacteroidales bacterium]|nr:DUF4783 domain-containing protein [Bacteroidales bacterium]
MLQTIIYILVFSVHPVTDTISSWKNVNDGIRKAIATGDASQLATFFAPTIQLSIPGNKGEFSKVQAEILMKDFFSSYPPVSFEVVSEGRNGDNSFYTIGKYFTQSRSFNVYYVVEKKGNSIQMHILKFE